MITGTNTYLHLEEKLDQQQVSEAHETLVIVVVAVVDSLSLQNQLIRSDLFD